MTGHHFGAQQFLIRGVPGSPTGSNSLRIQATGANTPDAKLNVTNNLLSGIAGTLKDIRDKPATVLEPAEFA